jgi:hypothetical protein
MIASVGNNGIVQIWIYMHIYMHLCKSTKPETPSTCVGVPQNYSGEPLGINFTVPVEDHYTFWRGKISNIINFVDI